MYVAEKINSSSVKATHLLLNLFRTTDSSSIFKLFFTTTNSNNCIEHNSVTVQGDAPVQLSKYCQFKFTTDPVLLINWKTLGELVFRVLTSWLQDSLNWDEEHLRPFTPRILTIGSTILSSTPVDNNCLFVDHSESHSMILCHYCDSVIVMRTCLFSQN